MSSSTTEATTDVMMPALGSSVTEGTVVAWNVGVGDEVAEGDPICEISSDKTDAECPAPAAGRVAELLVEVGETVDVGTPLARIGGDEAKPATAAFCTPVVARMAAVHDLDVTTIDGSGRLGRVTKRDVEAHLATGPDADAEPEERPLHSESPYRPDPPAEAEAAAPAPVPAAAPGGTPVELSRMRQSIGRAMRGSLSTAATCTTVIEVDVTSVERRRRELGVTALPVIARRVVEVLGEFDDLNATLDGATLTRHTPVHLGIAVSLGDDGLVVPVVRDAQDLTETGLSNAIRSLAKRARAGELGPDDYAGATFTITSPGAFGALIATPIINVPQVAILDVEAITRRPVVVADADGQESIAIRSMAYFCMSWDHRALDGVYAARFLARLRDAVVAAS